MRDPFKARLPVPTPAEIHRRLQQRAPDPVTILLSPKERAALTAYRAKRERERRVREARWDNDPLTATWMR